MSKRQVIILDVTRMAEGAVCIAGVSRNLRTGDYENVRPVLNGKKIQAPFADRHEITPFTVMNFVFTGIKKQPPHVEDLIFDPEKVEVAGRLSEVEQKSLLEEISLSTPGEIFGDNLIDGKYLPENSPGNSLGCLKIARLYGPYVNENRYEDSNRKFDIKAAFKLGDAWHRYPVTDRRMFLYVKRELESGKDLEQIQSQLQRAYRGASPVYLRLGLSRPWPKPDCEGLRCYVQVNSILTAPERFPAES